jgi:hypothetical protein
MIKKRIIIGFGLGIILLGFILYLFLHTKDVPFNKVDFKDWNFVSNSSSLDFADTIVYAGLNAMGMDNMIVRIKDLDIASQRELSLDISYDAYIQYQDNTTYNMYVSSMDRDKSLTTISHELIHLKQYYDKRLVIVDNDIVIWEGQPISLSVVEYNYRPWEIEAFDKQKELENKIRKILY